MKIASKRSKLTVGSSWWSGVFDTAGSEGLALSALTAKNSAKRISRRVAAKISVPYLLVATSKTGAPVKVLVNTGSFAPVAILACLT